MNYSIKYCIVQMVLTFLIFLLVLLSYNLYHRHYISMFMVFLLIMSTVGGLLINKIPAFSETIDVFNFYFQIGVFLIFILAFKNYTKFSHVNFNIREKKFSSFSKVIQFMCLFSLIVNLLGCIAIWTVVDDYNSFKQGGEATTEFMYSLPIPHYLLTMSSLLSSTSYFALGLHFVYLIQEKYIKAILFLIFSFALPLEGLMMFSRSSLAQYILIYISYLLFLFHFFNPRTKKIIGKISVSFLLSIIIVMTIITLNRFDGANRLIKPEGSFIQDDVLFSLFDYLSQWFKNGIDVMRGYNFSPLYGDLSNTLFNFISGLFGYKIDTGEIRKIIWPEHWYTFNGLPAILLFDFGYFLTIGLCLIYYKIIGKLGPKGNQINIDNILIFGILLTLPIMSIFGSYLEVLSYHFACIGAVLMKLYFKYKIKLL